MAAIKVHHQRVHGRATTCEAVLVRLSNCLEIWSLFHDPSRLLEGPSQLGQPDTLPLEGRFEKVQYLLARTQQ
ncbi:MAG: hypothetical protein ACLQNE_42880 [Thermoguttaceae bacterium]